MPGSRRVRTALFRERRCRVCVWAGIRERRLPHVSGDGLDLVVVSRKIRILVVARKSLGFFSQTGIQFCLNLRRMS